MFDRFYRADSARALPGSGLGLPIVQRVVDARRGRVTVGRSTRGGALLQVGLPAASVGHRYSSHRRPRLRAAVYMVGQHLDLCIGRHVESDGTRRSA
jgi:hypothetical protein